MLGHGRDFNALLGSQFLGVFNDNLFKQLVLLLAVDTLFPGQDMQGIAFAVFALPFVLFSGMAGDLSERFSKRSIIVRMKMAEIVIMVLGIGALMTVTSASFAWPALLVVLFVMGTQSAFFGPAKYGVIPEIVPPTSLVPANGAIAMTTFLGALVGIGLAGPLLDWFGPATPSPKLWAPGVVSVGLAVVGTIVAMRMRALKALRPDLKVGLNPFGRLLGTMKMLSAEKGLMHLVMLNSFFWFNSGAISQAINGMSLPEYLDMQQKTDVSYLTATISVGIILGSALAPRLARHMKLSRLVVLGAVLMVAAQMAMLAVGPVLTRANGAYPFAMGLLALCGIGGAIMIVPVQSYLQNAPPVGKRGQTFAVNNFMNFLFMMLSGAFYHVMVGGLGPVAAQAVGGGLLLAWLVYARKSVAAIVIDETTA
jgi:acyl-[acyl-carrier-protein]-phospholipid O-acyltransferase/long-chain-fatty-acid--[acyl-carrier-protein] ligase